MNILVIGGAGYIGSHMTLQLEQFGHQVIVLDNLCSGQAAAVGSFPFYEADMADIAVLDVIFRSHTIDAVMHFAAHIEVAESVSDPAKYYKNNVAKTQLVLDAMCRHKVKQFIFSSTAAIFGNPSYTPINEEHPTRPVNPYGRSKLMVEQMLADYDHAYGIRSVCLRYFNASGADPQGRVGECHHPETHLIPLVLQAASGRRQSIAVYGVDYETVDGSCVRDYIHVNDLCLAHSKALTYLVEGGDSRVFNLGNGEGFSVLEIIQAARAVTSKAITMIEEPRRIGDPAILIADASLAKEVLGWCPERPALEDIIADAWAWEQKLCIDLAE